MPTWKLSLMLSIKGHIYNYIAKPWEPFDLENLIDKAAERFHLAEDLRRTNRQLQVALEDLKTLDAAKTQFMLLINHELKTPLTAILSFSELLKESSLSDEQIIFQKRIHQNAERLKNWSRILFWSWKDNLDNWTCIEKVLSPSPYY